MVLPTPDMSDCCKKMRCACGTVNEGAIYSTCDTCKGEKGEFNSDTCDCEGDGICYGAQASYSTCSDPSESFCFQNASIQCEESLGGCPSLVSTTDTSGYDCDKPSGAFTLGALWQYPDGSFAQTNAATGANAQIQNASVTALSRVTCGSGPCSAFE